MTSIKFNLLLLIGVALAVPKQASAQEVQVPVWNAHDVWTFSTVLKGSNANGSPRTNSTVRITVLSVNERNYSVHVDTTTEDLGEGRQESKDGKITKALNIYWRMTPQLAWRELEYLRWPLAVGKTWTFELPRPDDQALLATVRVTGWEDITVAAGKFHTMVVRVDASQKGGGRWFDRRTLWFAPEAKWFVKQQWAIGVGGAYVSEEGVWELQSVSFN